MNPPSNKVDKHGFPIPPSFDDGPSPGPKAAGFGFRVWRWGLVLVFVGLLIGAAFRTRLVDEGRQMMAGWLTDRAEKKFRLGDLPGALDDANRAASLAPDDSEVRMLRAELRLESGDVAGSLDDYNQLVRLAPKFAQAYLGRSIVLQRLNRHREAIDDLTKAIELGRDGDPTPLNNRAYARAIAGVELEEALADVQQALDTVERNLQQIELAMGNNHRAMSRHVLLLYAAQRGAKAAYLDTRGYLFYLLGRYQEAQSDLDTALELAEERKQRELAWLDSAAGYGPAARDRHERRLDQELAVMYHHRGQLHEKLGNQEQAQADLERGDKLGYNPAEGVF